MIPNRSTSFSFQMKFLKNLDRKSDSVGPFISALEASEVGACKGFSKELLWSLGVKKLKMSLEVPKTIQNGSKSF